MTHHTDAERAAFEAAYVSEKLRIIGSEGSSDGEKAIRTIHLRRNANGDYDNSLEAHFAWWAWQAARRAPAAPVPQGWIDPNDKAQKQYLPHIGERVLFKHDGRIYLGKHTGGSFKAEYPFGKTFGTWDCMWMYPSALDAAAPQPPEAAPVELPEPSAWMLGCQTMGGDVGWKLSWSKSGAGVCHRLSGEEFEHTLYTDQQVRELLAAHGIKG